MKVTFVWTHKWSTKEVLVSTRAITGEKTYIAFSADSKYPNLYSIKTEEVKKCLKQKNGKGYVYCIPLSYLTDEGPLPEKYYLEKEKSYNEYIAWKSKK